MLLLKLKKADHLSTGTLFFGANIKNDTVRYEIFAVQEFIKLADKVQLKVERLSLFSDAKGMGELVLPLDSDVLVLQDFGRYMWAAGLGGVVVTLFVTFLIYTYF